MSNARFTFYVLRIAGIICAMRTSRRSSHLLWPSVGLLAVAFAVRVSTLTVQSLWRDEVDALRFATAPWPELLSTFTRPGWNGPLYFVVLRGWIALTGPSEFALRYLSLLWGVMAVALGFALARRLAGMVAALVCSVFFAISPYFIWYSQEVKMYTLILAMATLAIYALRRAVASNRVVWWATLVVATSLAFYSHILAALLIPVEMILTLVWGLGARDRRWGIGALASFACLTLPYLPLLRWQWPLVFTPAQTGYMFYPFQDMLLVMLNGFATGISGQLAHIAYEMAARVHALWAGARPSDVTVDSGIVYTMPLWPAGLLLVAGLVVSEAQWRDKVALLVWLLLPPLALYLVSLNRPIFTDRYLIWIGPAYYLVVSLGAVALGRLSKLLGAIALIAVFGVAAAGTYFQSSMPIKSDLRGVAAYLDTRYSSGDLVIFQIPYIRYTFDYYYHKPYDGAEGLFTNYGMSDAEVDAQMGRQVMGRKTVWLVASEMEMWDSKLQVWKWLESHARRKEATVFAQVVLYRYEF